MFLQQVNKGKNEWWRWLATIALVFLGYLFGQVPIYLLMRKAVGDANGGVVDSDELEELTRTIDFDSYGIDPNLVLAAILMMFLFATITLWLGITKIHNRPFRSLTTPLANINWSKIMFSFGLWTFLSLLLEMGSYFMDPGNYIFNFNLSTFIPLLIISFTLLPIQTSFEEWFMRGYVMQGMSRWAVYRWIPLVLTSVFFGLLHIMNPEVGEFGLGKMMTYYIGVGLFLGILTLMDDSLELALGVHASTNIFGALFVTFESSALQTPAVFKLKEVDISLMIPVFFTAALIFTFICAKKYGWNDWSKAYGLIKRPENQIYAESDTLENDILDDSL